MIYLILLAISKCFRLFERILVVRVSSDCSNVHCTTILQYYVGLVSTQAVKQACK